jgi:hypothetical protein
MKATLRKKKPEKDFKRVLVNSGYSESVTENIWKVYNSPVRKKGA